MSAPIGDDDSWIINEINADPDATNGDANGDGTVNTSEDEFVEFVNNSGASVDISGWTLSDGAAVKHTFPAGTVVPHQGAIVVFGGGTPTGSFGGSVLQTASTGSLGLNNGGDTVTLTDSSAIDRAIETYGGAGGNDESLTRDPDITGSTLVQHASATGSGGSLFSPGTQIDGSSFPGFNGDITPPVLDGTTPFNPPDDATDIPVNGNLEVKFDENVQKATGNIVIKNSSDNSIIDTINVTSARVTVSSDTVTIDPSSDLNPGTGYYVEIDDGAIEDTSGNDYGGISGNSIWNFTTAFNEVTGTDGADNSLTGTSGNDRITGGQGRDVITGGGGSEDTIDLSAVMDQIGYGGSDPITDNYLSFRSFGSHTIIRLDVDGTATRGRPRGFLLVQNVTSGDLNNINNFII